MELFPMPLEAKGQVRLTSKASLDFQTDPEHITPGSVCTEHIPGRRQKLLRHTVEGERLLIGGPLHKTPRKPWS